VPNISRGMVLIKFLGVKDLANPGERLRIAIRGREKRKATNMRPKRKRYGSRP